jgi:hypothetical protein
MITRSQIVLGAIVAVIATIIFWTPIRILAGGSETFVAYSISAARVDGDPPKEWGLYREAHAKSNEIVLFEWDKRLLRLDIHYKEVREIKPDGVTRGKESITWPGDISATTMLPSDDWTFREGTVVRRLHLTLTSESHEIDIDLPTNGK